MARVAESKKCLQKSPMRSYLGGPNIRLRPGRLPESASGVDHQIRARPLPEGYDVEARSLSIVGERLVTR